jgi:hypothetical protein
MIAIYARPSCHFHFENFDLKIDGRLTRYIDVTTTTFLTKQHNLNACASSRIASDEPNLLPQVGLTPHGAAINMYILLELMRSLQQFMSWEYGIVMALQQMKT